MELAPNLWGQEVDLLHQMDKYWGRVQEYLNVLFSWRGMDSLVAEETSVLPGMEELASLMHITHLADSGAYDTIIIDAAPTGSTLQLLSFPDIARWYIEKIMPFERRTLQIARAYNVPYERHPPARRRPLRERRRSGECAGAHQPPSEQQQRQQYAPGDQPEKWS